MVRRLPILSSRIVIVNPAQAIGNRRYRSSAPGGLIQEDPLNKADRPPPLAASDASGVQNRATGEDEHP